MNISNSDVFVVDLDERLIITENTTDELVRQVVNLHASDAVTDSRFDEFESEMNAYNGKF